MEDSTPPRPPAGADAKYLLVVGGLLVLIVVLLAGLWLRERRRANAARAELALTQRNTVARGQLQAALTQMLRGRGPASRPRALQREDLPAETVTWNGHPRKVLRASAAAGERIGLLPGDVVVVAAPPATAPAN